MTKETREQVDAYQPLCLTKAEWAKWGPSVLDAVYQFSPETVDQAKRTIGLLARFAADAERWGWDPPLAEHLTMRSIDRHNAQFTNEGARRTRRSTLVSIGRVINPSHLWPPDRQKMGRSRRKPPFTHDELASLHAAARHREPESHRRLFQVVLSFCLGAGHDGRTLHLITPEMVEYLGPSHVRLSPIGGRPHMELGGIHAQWVAYWAAHTEPGRPVVGPRGTYNGRVFVLIGDDGKTQLSVSRLRTTFVTHLLAQQNLSACEILQLSGLSSTASLDLYREFLPVPDFGSTAAKFAALKPIFGGGR